MGDRRGVSYAVSMALAAIVALVIAALAAYAFIQSAGTSTNIVVAHAQTGKAQAAERLTLIYWAPDGRAWIANDGPVTVTIVKVYVDGAAKTLSPPVTIDPRKNAVIFVGAGNTLAVETASGAIHVLKR